MKAIAEIFFSFITNKNSEKDDKVKFIFYKIVDFLEERDEYVLQCINTKALFNSKIADLVFDIDILYGLHPIQSCFIGIEYVKYLKKTGDPPKCKSKQQKKIENHSICRYGEYHFHYQDREGNVCFISKKTNQKLIMDPRDIALSENLIREFDAAQAFHIGFMAGLKMKHVPKRPYLRIVK